MALFQFEDKALFLAKTTSGAIPSDKKLNDLRRTAEEKGFKFLDDAIDLLIDEIENSGMDEGRFFVHLKRPYSWNTDPQNPERIASASFGNITEVRRELKDIRTDRKE